MTIVLVENFQSVVVVVDCCSLHVLRLVKYRRSVFWLMLMTMVMMMMTMAMSIHKFSSSQQNVWIVLTYLRMSCHRLQNPGCTGTRNFRGCWNIAHWHDKRFLHFHIRVCLHKRQQRYFQEKEIFLILKARKVDRFSGLRWDLYFKQDQRN